MVAVEANMIDLDYLAVLAPFLVVVAGVLALPITSLLLRRYRKSVVRLMSARGDHAVVTRPAEASAAAAMPPLGQLRRRATGRVAAHVAITVAAGLFIGLTYAMLFSAWNELEFDWIQFAFLTLMFSWPAVPGIWISTDGDRRWTAGALAIYFVAVIVLPAFGTAAGPLTGLIAWAWFNGLPTLIAVVFFTRSFRAIGICVLGVTLAALVGSQAMLSTLESDAVARLAVEVGSLAGINDAVAVFLLVAGFGFVAAGAIGWWLLSKIGRWYSHHRFSDHMLLLGSLCFVFCIDYVAVVTVSDPRALAVGLLLFASLAAASLLAYRLLIGTRPEPARLLLLRVFDTGSQGPILLNRIAARWRFVGPVQLIAGPDLALSTVEPDEFLTFTSGNLRRLFIADQTGLESRIAEQGADTDPDGRFRLEEFFCFDTTWRATVDALVARSEAVVLDLRGFTRERKGAAEELGLLGRRGVFDRTVVITDGRTDLELVESIVASSAPDRPGMLSLANADPTPVVGWLFDHARALSSVPR